MWVWGVGAGVWVFEPGGDDGDDGGDDGDDGDGDDGDDDESAVCSAVVFLRYGLHGFLPRSIYLPACKLKKREQINLKWHVPQSQQVLARS